MNDYTYINNLKSILKYKFNNYELIEKNFSHIHQDMFVLSILNGKHNGTYLEIGGNYPLLMNNTFLLESVFNWTGFSIEILAICVDQFNRTRRNPAFCADALKVDYVKMINENFGNIKIIDYLSLDIDPPQNTFEAFKKLPNNDIKFRVITFEHDSYTGLEGQKVRVESREYFKKLGYDLVINDVCWQDLSVEDWYVYPEYVDMDIVEKIRCVTDKGKHHQKYFYQEN